MQKNFILKYFKIRFPFERKWTLPSFELRNHLGNIFNYSILATLPSDDYPYFFHSAINSQRKIVELFMLHTHHIFSRTL